MKLILHIQVLMNLLIKLSLVLGLFGHLDVKVLSEHENFILKLLDLFIESHVHLLQLVSIVFNSVIGA